MHVGDAVAATPLQRRARVSADVGDCVLSI